VVRFGAQLYPYASFGDLAEIVEFAKAAEAAGFDYVCIPDHTIFPVEQEPLMGQDWYDPLIIATHLANNTSTIRLNFSVLVLPQRHPVHTAKQIATVDVISGGRVDVGIAVGWLKDEFEHLGENFHDRGRRTDEYIRVMQTLWTTHPCAFDGEWVSFANASFHPKPVQKPHPPIQIGGSWRASAARAAEFGSSWAPLDVPAEEWDDAVALLRAELEQRGRDAEGFPIYTRLPLFSHSDASREHAEEAGSLGIQVLDGDPEKAIEFIRAAEASGVTHQWVELPVGRQLEELDAFSKNVIAVL
jgi:probable F420-dependent oxidoreductase